MERHIFLVGMPGSGKSALGRRVAQKLQIPYLDTDVYLTETTGMNTAQLYTTFGEQAFRDGETRLLQQLVNATPGIISTGGGVATKEEDMKILRDNAIVISLAALPHTILKRTGNDKRPLLAKKTKEERLKTIVELMAKRAKFYKNADLIVKTDNTTPLQNVEIILKYLKGVR